MLKLYNTFIGVTTVCGCPEFKGGGHCKQLLADAPIASRQKAAPTSFSASHEITFDIIRLLVPFALIGTVPKKSLVRMGPMFSLPRVLAVALLSGVFFISSQNKANALAIDLASLDFEAEASAFLSARGDSEYANGVYNLSPQNQPSVSILSSVATNPTFGATVATNAFSLNVTDATGSFTGTSLAILTDVNLIEILFGITSDSTGLPGSHVAVSILHFGDASRAVDVFSAGDTTDSAPLDFTRVTPLSAVPLPASMLMLLSGIGFIAAFGHRKRTRIGAA